MADSRIEKSFDSEDKDMFDEAFGVDEEKQEAKKRLAEKNIDSKGKAKAGNTNEEDEENEEEGGEDEKGAESGNNKSAGDDSDDEDDSDLEDSGNNEPVIFGEVGEEEQGKEKEENKNSDESGEKEEEFESKDETVEGIDSGTQKKKKSKNNFDEIVDDGLEKSIRKGEESIKENENSNKINSKENIKSNGKGYGGKLDLKVTNEEEAEEEVLTKAHPIERKIIKSVIKNKAMMAAKEGVNVNSGVKISDDSIGRKKKNSEKDEEHDELADALLWEDGTKEEGIEPGMDEGAEKEDEEMESGRPRLPKAVGEEEEEADESKDGKISPSLEFLMSEKGHAFIGRKKSVLMKYGEEAGLFVGKVNEKDREGTDVYLDGLNPHVVFVCGSRGSGKSYLLGVIAEELALKNKNVGIVVVDPIGVFWSMKRPNSDEKELEALVKWNLMPKGLNNVKVFIPVGMKDSTPKSTYDAVFSIQPALLTAEDWCLTFGIDRFSPTGLLMEKGIAKVKKGYRTEEGKEVRGKENTFTLEDLIRCFETDAELNDKERGYKSDSIRALASRFDAAKHWGIFDDKGTSLALLSRAGQMTILDTSFLEDNVSALVIGIISRRILAARKLGTRREAAAKLDETGTEEVLDLNIPPTWLFIDEAHTLIPGGNTKTPASNALVEYVKQGRRPGCSLVFATQQPSAIDSKVLSQLDVIVAHKLVFDDDIKAIAKRTPNIVPYAYKKSSFIKTMPVGIALTGDRSETTSRAFILGIRPRMSQHEGRDAETVEVKQEMEKDKVEVFAMNIVLRQLKKDPSVRVDSIQETIETLNNTYKKNIKLEDVLKLLEKKGVETKEGYAFAPGVLEEMAAEEEEEKSAEENITKQGSVKELGKELNELEKKLHSFEEKIELTALEPKVDEQKARKIFASNINKKFLFLKEEIVDRVTLKHAQVYKINFKYFSHKDAFHVGEAYINSLTGEFIHEDKGTLKESKGLNVFKELSESEATVLKLVAEKKRSPKEVAEFMRMEEGNAKRILDSLVKKKLISFVADQKGKTIYIPDTKIEMELPPTPMHELLTSIGKMPITEVETAAIIPPKINEREIPELMKKLWGNVVVKEITHIFLPVWEGTLKRKTGEERTILIDAINGKRINGTD